MNSTENSSTNQTSQPSGFQFNYMGVAVTQLMLMVSYAFIYVFSLWVIWREKEMISMPCYKIMFLLGVIDVSCCVSQVTFNNVCTIAQNNFSMPLQKYLNAFFTSCWYGMYTTAVVLSINRFLTVISPSWARRVFSGWAFYIWFIIIAAFMSIPAITFSLPHQNDGYFDVRKHVWAYDGITFDARLAEFQRFLYTSCAAAIATCHLIMLVKINKLRAMIAAKMNHENYSAFVPPFCMSVLLAALAVFFFYICPYFTAPWATLLTDYIGNAASGVNGIFYVLFNTTIRTQFVATIRKACTCCKVKPSTSGNTGGARTSNYGSQLGSGPRKGLVMQQNKISSSQSMELKMSSKCAGSTSAAVSYN